MFRKSLLTIAATALMIAPAFAQPAAPAAPAAPVNLQQVANSAEVQALVARIKTMPHRPLIAMPFAAVGPYRVTVEYRSAQDTTAAVHDTEGELDYVIDGTGTFIYGGTLVAPTRTNATNQAGTKIEGGTSQHVSKGDWMVLSPGQPHHTIPDAGTDIVLMTFHIPGAAPK